MNEHLDSPVTLADAWESFLADLEARKVSSSTIGKYKLLQLQFTAYGLTHVTDFNLETLSRFRATWKDGPRTAGRKLERLRAFFRYATERHWTDTNPAALLPGAGERWREEHQAELIEYRKKRHATKQPRVSDAELERLRLPENRLESLCYGPEKQVVCLNCGRIGKNLSHHLPGCPVTPESSDAYKERWGFDRSNPLTSPKQREAYSQSHRQSPTFRQAQEKARKALLAARAARTGSKRGPMRLESKLKRRGKRTGARPHLQKILDPEFLKILELDLPIAKGAKRARLSPTAYYRRGQRLGWDFGAARTREQRVHRLVSKLGRWTALQPQTPTVEQIMQHYIDDLRSGLLTPSRELSSFRNSLEAELRECPKRIAEIAVEAAQKKLTPKTLSLGSRVLKRMRAESTDSAAPAASTKPRKKHEHAKDWQPKATAFRKMVDGKIPRFRTILQRFREMRKIHSPDEWKKQLIQLRVDRDVISEKEFDAVLQSKTARAAAIRWASALEGINYKTGKNLYSQSANLSKVPDK